MARRRPRATRWMRVAIAGLATLLVASAFLLFRDGPVAGRIEATTLDWRFRIRGPQPAPEGVVILAIDDATVAAAGRFPLPRRMLAEAVSRLTQLGATTIGIDLLLLDREQPSDGLLLSVGDRALLEALAKAPPTELSYVLTFAGPGSIDDAGRAALADGAYSVVRWPPGAAGEDLLLATGAVLPMAPVLRLAGVGYANGPVDSDGALRHIHLGVALDDRVLPAFPVALARRLLGLGADEMALVVGRSLELGGRSVPLDRQSRLALDYYGPPGTIRTLSLSDLIEGRIDRRAIEGRAALIGATALGVGDSFVTPFSRALPGVEVLATAVSNLAAGRPLDHGTGPQALSLAAILVLGALAFALTQWLPPTLMTVASAALLAGWAALAQLAFARAGLWLDIVFPSAAVLAAGAVGSVGRILAERGLRRDVERQRGNLLRYHSPLIAELLAESDAPLTAGEEQPAAILFVDMAGFTKRTEQFAPAETARFLREFHRRIETASLAEGGVLEQFTGDGAMVVFGLPRPGPADAAAAVACARRLLLEIGEWNAARAGRNEPPLEIRIGVHCGPVALATLGGESQRQMTVAGDTVNVASRLEALARHHDVAVVISDAVAVAVRASDRSSLLEGFEALPPQQIRGRGAPLAVWILRAVDLMKQNRLPAI